MTARRVAVWAAAGALAVWLLKALAIWIAGGLDESPLEPPLFALGLVLAVAAFAALGVSLAPRRGGLWLLLAGLAGAAAGFAAILVIESLVGSLFPDDAGWVREEAGLWVAAAVTLALTLIRARRGAPEPAA